MLKSVLVPLDGTRFGERALPVAEGIAQATGAALHLAHVHIAHPHDDLMSSPSFQWEGGNLDEFDEKDRAEEQSYLTALADRVARESSAAVDSTLLDGDVTDSLQRYARKVSAELVILTTHARSGLEKVWTGSVADALIRGGDAPVLAIPENAEPRPPGIRSILIPLDGSPLSESVIPDAVELARVFGSRVTLLQVLTSRFPATGGLSPAHPDAWTEALAAGEAYLDRICRRLKARGLTCVPMVLAHPRPAEAIHDVAAEVGAELVAMSTHGYSGVRRALFGSTAEAVLRKCHLPVLIRRPREREA